MKGEILAIVHWAEPQRASWLMDETQPCLHSTQRNWPPRSTISLTGMRRALWFSWIRYCSVEACILGDRKNKSFVTKGCCSYGREDEENEGT